MSNEIFFESNFHADEKQPVEKTSSYGERPSSYEVPKNDFRSKICTREVDMRNLLDKGFAADKLVLVPNFKVAGKGIDRELDFCSIFIQFGNRKYVCNFLPDSSEEYSDIPQDAMFIVIGEADAVYVILKNEVGKNSAYLLEDDAIVAIYFQTKQDRLGSRFYGCAIRDRELDFCRSWVTVDPLAMKFLFRVFIETTKIERDGKEESESMILGETKYGRKKD